MNPEFLWNAIYTDTHLQDSCGRDGSRKFHWDVDGKKVPNWECLFVHRKQRLFLSENVGRHQNDSKEADYGSHVEEIDEKR